MCPDVHRQGLLSMAKVVQEARASGNASGNPILALPPSAPTYCPSVILT